MKSRYKTNIERMYKTRIAIKVAEPAISDGTITSFSFNSYVDTNYGYVFSGTYKPDDSLSEFNGKNIIGKWQLSGRYI